MRDGDAVPATTPACHLVRGLSILDGEGCPCLVVGRIGGEGEIVHRFLECPPEAQRVLAARRTLNRGVSSVSVQRVPPRPAPKLTGDVCPDCRGSRLQRAGPCLLCLDCGSTNGGCS